jgi:hypothetical protein
MKKLSFILMSLILSSGCSTVIKGTNQPVTFQSEPNGAAIFIDGERIGSTPMTIRLTKNKKSSVMIKKDGYDTVSRDLTKEYDPVTLLNIFWDLSTTDMITGAAFEYEPNAYFFELQPKN